MRSRCANAIDWLTGAARDPRLDEVTLALGAELLLLGGLARRSRRGAAQARGARDSGAAAERFQRMVAALGGPADLVERPEQHLPRAAVVRPVGAAAAASSRAIDVRAIGLAILALGGGRRRVEDASIYGVGLADMRGHRRRSRARPAARHRPCTRCAGAEQAAAAIRAAVEHRRRAGGGRSADPRSASPDREPMAATASAAERRSVAARLSFFYVAVFLFVGVGLPFWPVWLADQGISAAGSASCCRCGWMKLVGNPLIAQLADRCGECAPS